MNNSNLTQLKPKSKFRVCFIEYGSFKTDRIFVYNKNNNILFYSNEYDCTVFDFYEDASQSLIESNARIKDYPDASRYYPCMEQLYDDNGRLYWYPALIVQHIADLSNI